MIKNLLFAFAICFFLLGCINQEIKNNGQHVFNEKDIFNQEIELNAMNFQSISQLNEFIKSRQNQIQYYGSGFGDFFIGDVMRQDILISPMMESVASMDMDQGSINSKQLDFSTTNIQVESVDEGDIIKTDGNYIYTKSDNIIHIIRAYPADEAEKLSKIDLSKYNVEGMFINEDYLVVFGNIYNYELIKDYGFSTRSGASFYNIYDVSNRKNPRLIKEYKFEGSYFRSRMIGDNIYLILNNGPLSSIYRPDPRPIIVEGDNVNRIAISDIYYYPINYDNAGFITVHALSLNDLDKLNTKTVAVEYAQNLYMSTENIYITYTKRVNEYDITSEITRKIVHPYLSVFDKNLIERIENTDSDILSNYEKQSRIMRIYNDYINMMDRNKREEIQDKIQNELKNKLKEYEYFEYTIINKLGVKDADITIGPTGKVPGYVNNQFSMDEKDSVLRIATTISSRWDRFNSKRIDSQNHVYTLNKNLEIMDSAKGLGITETIYSARFIDDRLYMVTFRQIDPFYVIDLKDPNNIEVLGELKITGFSTYLHPYDENTIIGIGREATETGMQLGLKISLYDVSDVENPIEIAQYVTDERHAQSTALYEHKAFLFSREKNLLVIPAYSGYRYGQNDMQSYNGAFVFDIRKDSIKLRGLIDHSNSTTNFYSPAVERSLYIEELLYTKSNNLLRINKLEDLSSVKNIKLDSTASTIQVY